MASPKKNGKRRSLYGTRCSLLAPSKSFRLSITDRVKYRYKSSEEDRNKTFHPDSLLLITQHSWNLYRVSHVWNVEYSTVKLKQYAARIKNELIKHIKDTTTDITFNTKVQVLPEPKESDNDANSLQIDVFYKKDENKPVLKYRAVLLSWDNNENSNGITQLPLLLCTGTINITRIVHTTLSNIFDIVLHPLRISEDDLIWLSAMLSDSTNRKNSVSYEYSLFENSIKAPITVSLSSTLIKDLWNHTHPPESEYINYKEVQKYHEHITNQLEANFGINFKGLKLNKIVMCDAAIACEGKLKIYSEDAVSRILWFINDVLLLLDSSSPEMCDELNNTS